MSQSDPTALAMALRKIARQLFLFGSGPRGLDHAAYSDAGTLNAAADVLSALPDRGWEAERKIRAAFIHGASWQSWKETRKALWDVEAAIIASREYYPSLSAPEGAVKIYGNDLPPDAPDGLRVSADQPLKETEIVTVASVPAATTTNEKDDPIFQRGYHAGMKDARLSAPDATAIAREACDAMIDTVGAAVVSGNEVIFRAAMRVERDRRYPLSSPTAPRNPIAVLADAVLLLDAGQPLSAGMRGDLHGIVTLLAGQEKKP